MKNDVIMSQSSFSVWVNACAVKTGGYFLAGDSTLILRHSRKRFLNRQNHIHFGNCIYGLFRQFGFFHFLEFSQVEISPISRKFLRGFHRPNREYPKIKFYHLRLTPIWGILGTELASFLDKKSNANNCIQIWGFFKKILFWELS